MTDAITDKKLSRRQFVGTAAAGAAAIGAVAGAGALIPHVAATPSLTGAKALDLTGGLTAASAVPVKALPTAIPSNWDYTADVVILGTGLAGLAAAIAAYDAGVTPLILEKMPQTLEGGSSKVAVNYIFVPSNPTTLTPNAIEGAIWLKACAVGTVEDDSVFTAESQGYVDNFAWIQALGGTLGTYSAVGTYPSNPASAYYHTFCLALPGAPVQSNGFPVGSAGDGRLWQLFRDNATKRNIKVLYQTPGTQLIQDPNTGEIKGVYATSNGAAGSGSTLAVKANKGVILACGGFEMNVDMQRQYWMASPQYTTGCPGNTGDGIKMAQKVGADLWHMNFSFGTFSSFVIPGTDPTVSGVVAVSPPGIKVNKLGNRFNNNTAVNTSSGGFANEMGVNLVFDNTTLDWDAVPCWAIFDDAARKKGPVMTVPQVSSPGPGVAGRNSWFVHHSGYTWSADNSAEIASGWITSAPDLNTLATAIAADPDNLAKITGAQLTATVNAWNADITAGTDAQFLTSVSGQSPISTAPFYAMKLFPTNVDPPCGPRRNKFCQVQDPFLQPIPRLYSAGEMGAFWGWAQSSGSHLAECIWTGRTAGQNASLLTSWS
jgi:hypothetical protein